MDEILSNNLNNNTNKNEYYKILGCSQLSSIEQIQTEYKKCAITCHPDKNPDDPNAQDRFKQLQEAKDVLTDSVLRTKYDQWLNSGLLIPWKDWLQHTNSHQMVFHWTIKKPDAMITQTASDIEKNELETKNNQKTSAKCWSHDEHNELRNKFRNYQI